MNGTYSSELSDDPRCSVLLVEDDPYQRVLYDRLLRRWGYHTISVGTHDGARRALADQTCEVVVSDVFLGETTGFDLTRSFRDVQPDLPVVLMSSQESSHTRTEALRSGATAFVAKSEVDPKLQHAVFDALLWSMHESVNRRASQRPDPTQDRHMPIEDDLYEALLRLSVGWRPVTATHVPGWIMYECSPRSDWSDLADAASLLRAASERGALPELGRRFRSAIGAELTRRRDIDAVIVKVSPEELFDDALLSLSNPLLPHASRVVLDAGDAAMYARFPGARERLEALRVMDFRVALFDSTTQQHSRAAYQTLPHDIIALDYGIVRLCGRSSYQERCLRNLVESHRDRGVEVLIDGVETAEERAIVMQADVQYLQGDAVGDSRTLAPFNAS